MKLLYCYTLFLCILFAYFTSVNSDDRAKLTHIDDAREILDSSKIIAVRTNLVLNSPNYKEYYETMLEKLAHIINMYFNNLHTKSVETIKIEMETNLNQSTITLGMILDCKQFMQYITNETESDFSINLTNFFENMLLKRIYEVANIQSHALDTKMIEMMYKQHNTNHPTNKKVVAKHPNKKVVIIGADETGLYAALQFFLAGFEVTLIGEKQPESENNHILVLNDKWIIQLHIFLGTKYSQILVDNENTSSYPSLIKVSSKRLQKAMLNRLEELTKYALENYKKSNNHFNQRLLDASKNHPNVQKWISGRVNTPLEIHLDAVATKVELVDSKHYLHVKNYKPILFDVLICMEEPKQIIRNMYIGIPNQPSITKDWLVAAWSKENHASKVLEAEFIEDWLEMKELEEFLDEKNFDEVIEKSNFFTPEVHNEFFGIVDKMILSQQIVRTHLFETKERVYLAVELNKILAEILDKLQHTIMSNKEKDRNFYQLKEKLENNWMKVVANKYNQKMKAEKSISLNIEFFFDIEHMTLSSLTQRSLDKPVTVYSKHSHAVLAAWGDSAVSSQFYPKMQLSLAKKIIDKGVKTFEDYNQGCILTMEKHPQVTPQGLEKELYFQTQNIKAEDAQWIRDDSKEKESSPTAVTMCSLIENMRRNENFEQEYGFKVESDKEVTTEQPYFNVEKEGKKSNARVTNNGLITFEKD